MGMSTYSRRVLTALLVMGVPSFAMAGAGIWTGSGPYGGIIGSLVINPVTPTILYTATGGGVFKSVDGGVSWRRAQNGIPDALSTAWELVMDADAPDTLLAFDSSGRLMRTSDAAVSWRHTGFTLANGDYWGGFSDVPGVTNTFFLALTSAGSSPGGRILKTTDNGATFTALAGGLPANQPFNVVTVDPSDPNRVLAGTAITTPGPSDPTVPAIWRSLDGGATWAPVFSSGGLGGANAVNSISWGQGSMVYANVDRTLMRSNDDGATWTTTGYTNDIATVTAHPTMPGTVYVGTRSGYYVSLNASSGVATFAGPHAGLAPNPTYTDAASRPVQSLVRRIVLDPRYPVLGAPMYVVTETAGLYKSVDSGATWSNANVNNGVAAVNVRGILVHPNPALGTGLSQRRVFASFSDGGWSTAPLFMSADGGGTWATTVNGLRGAQLRGLAFDPTTTGTTVGTLDTTVIYATGRAALSGLPGSLTTLPAVSIRNGGIYRSTTGGASWTVIDTGLARNGNPPNDFANVGFVRSIIIDPRSCGSVPTPVTGPVCTTGPLGKAFFTAMGSMKSNTAVSPSVPTISHRIGYTTTANNSDPALVTWINRENGLPQQAYVTVDPDGAGPLPPRNEVRETVSPIPIVMDPSNSDVLYVGTWNQFDNALTPVPTSPNGVFKTIDGGATWTLASNGLPLYAGSTNTHLDVVALAISPASPGTLWASVISNAVGPLPDLQRVTGLFKTIDGGATWTSSSSGIPSGLDVHAIEVDPTDANRLYASAMGFAAHPGAVYRSKDGGATWTVVGADLPVHSVLTLSIDPLDPQRLFAGSRRGVWTLDQVPDAEDDGASDAIENLAPNGGDGNGDGVPDATQADVASTVVVINAADRDAGMAGRGTLATAQGSNGYFTTDIQGTDCPKASGVHGTLAARNGRAPIPGQPNRYYSYPRDLVHFEIPNCAHAVVDITFHNLNAGGLPNFTDPFWSFRTYAPQTPGVDATLDWFDLGSRAQVIGPNRWRITLDANQFGSYRPNNDNILFVGGPAYNDERVFANGFE